MFNSIKDMYKAANWNGKGLTSRENLMEKLQSNLIYLKKKIFFVYLKIIL